MKLKIALFFALSTACMIAGGDSAFGQKLYPVQGPLAAQTPPPIFTARFSGSNSGKFSMVQANGESFKGTWVFVTPSFVNAKTPGPSVSYLPQPNLAFAWDAIYGEGYFLAQVLGKRIKQVSATGDRGTVLQVEELYADQQSAFNGVAVDNKGNIYKLVV
jgi:hypothetical protein